MDMGSKSSADIIGNGNHIRIACGDIVMEDGSIFCFEMERMFIFIKRTESDNMKNSNVTVKIFIRDADDKGKIIAFTVLLNFKCGKWNGN